METVGHDAGSSSASAPRFSRSFSAAYGSSEQRLRRMLTMLRVLSHGIDGRKGFPPHPRQIDSDVWSSPSRA